MPGNRPNQQPERLDTSSIRLSGKLTPDLFDSVARDAARVIGDNRRSNKPSQLRKFYDELCMWEEKVRARQDKFDEYLPFIRMMNAKAAYALGRNKLVDENYVDLLNTCLKQVEDVESMTRCKLFMESFMGFYKQMRPKD